MVEFSLRVMSSRSFEREPSVVVILCELSGVRNIACWTATLSLRAWRQARQTPVAITMSSRGRRTIMSQISSFVLRTACAAS